MTEYCQIELTQGQIARVSTEDWEELSRHNWYATDAGNGFYAVRKKRDGSGKKITCLMHRAIMNPPDGIEVDHVNRNTLDNRRENLRLATRAQNAMNTSRSGDNKSGFMGVSPRRGGWRARIRFGGRQHELGVFASPEAAYSVYCAAAIKHRGEFASIAPTAD